MSADAKDYCGYSKNKNAARTALRFQKNHLSAALIPLQPPFAIERCRRNATKTVYPATGSRFKALGMPC